MPTKKQSLVEQEKQRQDLGFGTKATSTSARMITSTGDFNVKKLGQSFEVKLNLYHRLITMYWLKFIGVIFAFYLLLNFIFASIYYFIGVEYLDGVNGLSGLTAFQEAFFFCLDISNKSAPKVALQIRYIGIFRSLVLTISFILFKLITNLLIKVIFVNICNIM